MNDNGLPAGAVAYREYEVPLADGGNAGMVFMLAHQDADSIASDLARALHARAYGFVFIRDYPGGPRYPVVWLQMPTQLALTVADGDDDLSKDLKQIIVRHLIQFIRDIAPIAPELARSSLRTRGQFRPFAKLASTAHATWERARRFGRALPPSSGIRGERIDQALAREQRQSRSGRCKGSRP